jgi:hypothetical protein
MNLGKSAARMPLLEDEAKRKDEAIGKVSYFRLKAGILLSVTYRAA